MDPLHIHLLGPLRVSRGDVRLPPFPTQQSRALFALLLIHRGRPCSRHVVMGHLWGDRPEGDARKALRTALWRLRAALEPDGVEPGSYIRVRADEIGFNWDSAYWLDAEELEDQERRGRLEAEAGRAARAEPFLARAAELYGGVLLEGHYQEWSLREGERLRAVYLRALEQLMTIHVHQDRWLPALQRGDELLRHDPLREHVHRDLIRCEYLRGNRPGALRRYEACRRLLGEELGIEPMRETRELLDRIRDGAEPRVRSGSDPVPSPGVPGLIDVADELERLALRLRRGDPSGRSGRRSRRRTVPPAES